MVYIDLRNFALDERRGDSDSHSLMLNSLKIIILPSEELSSPEELGGRTLEPGDPYESVNVRGTVQPLS